MEKGEFQRIKGTWLRFYDSQEQLVLTEAEAEAQRADTAETEVARLRAFLAEKE